MANTQFNKPAPSPSPSSQHFWSEAREHRLVLQVCLHCGETVFYPRQRCPACWRDALTWREASGKGTVVTYTIIHKPSHPAFSAEAPYVVALIDLDEGARMLSNVIHCPVEEVQVGQRVVVSWEEQGQYTLPKFRPEAQS
ncbi:Zn-ribbon domain-containing OB-fold protein (plasmid) [Halomonas sediminis]